jgi:hypothetical protein
LELRTVYDEGNSEVYAIDVSIGEIVWVTEFPVIGFGGATMVNDLVFTAAYDGMILCVIPRKWRDSLAATGAWGDHRLAGPGWR